MAAYPAHNFIVVGVQLKLQQPWNAVKRGYVTLSRVIFYHLSPTTEHFFINHVILTFDSPYATLMMAKIDLKDNEFFEKLISSEPVSSHDTQYWYQLLSCSFNFSRISSQVTKEKLVDETLRPFMDLLALNNSQSLNIGSLVRVAIDRISRIKTQSGGQHDSTNPFYGFQSLNSIFLIRLICKNILETSSEEMLIQSFRARVDEPTQVVVKKPANPSELPPHLQKHPSSTETVQSTTQAETAQVVATTSANNVPTPDQPAPADASNGQVAAQLCGQAKVEITPGATILDQYISTLIAVIVDMPINDSTYLLQVEAINSLIVLLSIQMYSNTQAKESFVFRTLMHKKCSIHALVLTKTLLNNFVRQDALPQESGSIILGAAWVIEKTLWKVLTLGFGGPLEEESDEEGLPLLARQSLLLLNVLTNHNIDGMNPYREAIVSCQDIRFSLSDPHKAFDNANNDLLATAMTSKSVMASNSIKIEFNDLFDTICKNLHNNQVALLLYLLLHSNKVFKTFILTTCSSRMDQLVLPLLKILYSSIQKGSHAIYLIIILFVILSEDESFNKSLHSITPKGIPWFKDRTLSEISLASFTTLIIIRSVQYNTFRVKDKFLHTNLFATLGNLSNHFSKLHPYVCVRIVDLLERLAKRYLAVVKPDRFIESSSNEQNNRKLDILNSDNPLARALATDTQQRRELKDVSSLELDSTQTDQLSNNIEPSHQSENHNGINTNNNNNTVAAINIGIPQVDKTSPDLACITAGQQSPGSSNSEHINISIDDTKLDMNWIEEVIRMLLEIINNSLAFKLDSNSDLVYTLLYKRSVFNSLLSSHQSFYDQIINIERILTFFYNKIEAEQKQLTVDEIKEIISKSTRDWNFDQTRDPNSQLLFRYVEDEKPEDFFIPYMWEQIYYSSGISWNAKRIVLFNPEIL